MASKKLEIEAELKEATSEQRRAARQTREFLSRIPERGCKAVRHAMRVPLTHVTRVTQVP